MADDIPQAVRQAVYARDGFKCRWCGRHSVAIHVHHVRYRSEGGKHVLENLVSLCYEHHGAAHSSKERYQPLLLDLLLQDPTVTLLQLMRWRDERPVSEVPSTEGGKTTGVGRMLALE